MSWYQDELPPDFDKATVERRQSRLYCLACGVFWCFRILAIAALALLLLSASLALSSHSPAACSTFWSSLLVLAGAIATRRAAVWLRGRSERLYSLLRTHVVQEREHKEGLRPRTEHDLAVDPRIWTPYMSKTSKWAHGEVRERLPGDTVYQFFWTKGPTYGRGGYALERGGRIVAEHLMLIS